MDEREEYRSTVETTLARTLVSPFGDAVENLAVVFADEPAEPILDAITTIGTAHIVCIPHATEQDKRLRLLLAVPTIHTSELVITVDAHITLGVLIELVIDAGFPSVQVGDEGPLMKLFYWGD